MKSGFFPVLLLLSPIAAVAQQPTIRDLIPGVALGRYDGIGDVIELAGGAVLVSARESGDLWQLAPGASKGERLSLKGGEGPLSGLAWGGGDRAYTFSTRQALAYPFELSGRVGQPVGQPAGEGGPAQVFRGGSGSVIRPDSMGRVYAVERTGGAESPLVSNGPGGKRTETTIRGEAMTRIRIGQGGAAPSKAFEAADGWAVRPDGAVAVVRAVPYRVEWYREGRRTAEGAQVSFEPVATSTADSTELVAQRSRAMSRLPVQLGGGGAISGGGPAFLMPSHKPAFMAPSVRVATDGSVWVMLHGPAGANRAVWDHFDDTGKHLERVRLPEGTRAVGFGRGVIYAVRADRDLFRVPLAP